jgi:hypothetical protein
MARLAVNEAGVIPLDDLASQQLNEIKKCVRRCKNSADKWEIERLLVDACTILQGEEVNHHLVQKERVLVYGLDSQVFENMSNSDKLFQEAVRVLSTGGLFFC